MDEREANPLINLDRLIRLYCYPEWQELLYEKNTQVSFNKGEAIFTTGQKADRMFMVHRGCVKIVADLGKGQERITRLAGNLEVLGHRGIGNEPIYSASAIALTPTVVNVIPMRLFLSTLKANSLFCYNFLLYFTEEMRLLDQHLRDMMNMDVAQRVVKVLLLCRDTFGMDKEDPRKLAHTLARKDIANMSGTTYESVVRTLATLSQQGLIELAGKEVRLRKPKALERMVKP
ncbi:MAG TPA: Crp/Fnr family transcriptional regulator [Flavobacteriales bacterium]|nr:Crp/Fnr family transcriptional regulator [Flavobacteriales bacterium]